MKSSATAFKNKCLSEALPAYKIAPCLIQATDKDEYISQVENEALTNGTPQPKEVCYYDAKHELNQKAAQDRCQWLLSKV